MSKNTALATTKTSRNGHIATVAPAANDEYVYPLNIVHRDTIEYYLPDLLDDHLAWLIGIDNLLTSIRVLIARCFPRKKSDRNDPAVIAAIEAAREDVCVANAEACKAVSRIGWDVGMVRVSKLLRRVTEGVLPMAFECYLRLDSPLPNKKAWRSWWDAARVHVRDLANREIINELEEAKIRGGGENKVAEPAMILCHDEKKRSYSCGGSGLIFVSLQEHFLLQHFLKNPGRELHGTIAKVVTNPSLTAGKLARKFGAWPNGPVQTPGHTGRGTGYIIHVKTADI